MVGQRKQTPSPQIVAAALLGFFVGTFFGGEAIYALLVGGVSLVLAALLTLRVEDRDDVAVLAEEPVLDDGLAAAGA